MVAESLKLLRSDPGCKSAGYHPARNAFSVVRNKDNARKESRVLHLKRKRDATADREGEDLVKKEFEKAVHSVKQFLAAEALEAPALADAGSEDSHEEAQPDSVQE